MFIERFRTMMPPLIGMAVRPESSSLLAVVTFVFLAPNVDIAPNLTWHDGQRIAQLMLLAIVVLSFALHGVANTVADIWAALPRWSRMALFAAYTAGFVSCFQAQLTRWALLEWAMLLLLLVVVLSVAASRYAGGTHLDRIIVAAIFCTATAYATKAVVVYLAMLTVGATYGQGFNVRELFTGFSNIRFFGHVQTMLLPFLLLPALWWPATRWQRMLLYVVPALWWMLVVASGTRGTWIALIVGVLAVLVFGGKIGRRWIRYQLAGLVCGLVCYAAFVLLLPNFLSQPATFLHRAEDIISLSKREIIWAAAIGFSRENPWLGIGPMHFAYYANAVAAHPHNAVLQFAAEWGIPAALLFTALFAVAGLSFAARVRTVAANSDIYTGLTAVALLAALAGAAAQIMVDGILVMPVSQIVLSLICGWALGFYFTGISGAVQCGVVEKGLGVVFIVVAAASMAYGVQPEMSRLEQREADYLANHPSGTLLLPRFWAQGWINQ